MTITIIGQVATPQGLIQQTDLAGNAYPWKLPAIGYHRAQRRVPILDAHRDRGGERVGEVGYYERSKVDGLLMVGTVDDSMTKLLEDHDWHLSPGVESKRWGSLERGDAKIDEEIALVARASYINQQRVRFARSGRTPRLPLRWHDTWARANEAIARDRYRYRRDDALQIVDIDELDIFDLFQTDRVAAQRRVQSELDTGRVAKLRAVGPEDGQRVHRHAYPGTFMQLAD
jgi:hypothetical protein